MYSSENFSREKGKTVKEIARNKDNDKIAIIFDDGTVLTFTAWIEEDIDELTGTEDLYPYISVGMPDSEEALLLDW